uniref:ATP-binding cassette, subfamily C, EexD n=1 Tax=Candidatus Kentrum sp. UNK TaxID=2126344 RepID=A0A451ARB3_9GAMM|nr:MAG: ATP-binding cassette, subfamily C, EexD [Candidatus Kentron sp. UNK]VFK73633.1 MAG: ATP-binding cassette, subfamily C, EexD [Candidatus Kentron sp. UNK]
MDISVEVDRNLGDKVFTALFREALLRQAGASAQPFRDMETIRSVISGHGIISLLDLPWTPLFITLIFIMHPILGWVAVVGALVTVCIAIVSERISRPLMNDTSHHQIAAARFVDGCLGNSDAIHAMGMLENIRHRWLASYDQSVNMGATTAERVSSFAGTTKALRIILQSTILGTGAWLVLQNEASAGVMIAASIIFGRALAPLEQSIAASRGLLSAIGALKRLEALLVRHGDSIVPMLLPPPTGRLRVENLGLILPGRDKPLLQGISFALNAGEVLGIVGPSASGKSSLARALLGLWQPARGTVRLDDAELSQWESGALGHYIGYLPQDVELLTGTIRENISRFEAADSKAVVDVAVKAKCHPMILALPDGYDSAVGIDGNRLSGGQSQRVALARCLFGEPVLVILDEPDANLDVEGVSALDKAIAELKARNATVILITHNARLLRHADKAMLLANGTMGYFGPPRELMEKLGMRSKTTTERFS